ncbi:MAG TPA: holo-ACP synthase [Acidimicrobiales bacterium]|nr:holo-ACP synthase [Acidimicrobiales bacterium]
MTGTRGEEREADRLSGAAVRAVGIDAVDVARFRRVMTRRPRIADRVFTDSERAHAAAASDPAPRLAARFAAKEAVMKALGVGIGALAMRDVEVVKTEGGAPRIELAGTAEAIALRRGIGAWHVSLTHTDLVAIASVIAVGDGAVGGASASAIDVGSSGAVT